MRAECGAAAGGVTWRERGVAVLVAATWLVALALVLVVAVSSEAHTAKAGGWVVRDEGGGNVRCFALASWNENQQSVSCFVHQDDVAADTWQQDAGSCRDVTFHTAEAGALPPVVPNKVTLRVYRGNTATVVRTFVDAGALPAHGTDYTFCATTDGTAGGTALAGPFRLYVRAVKDNGPGGVGNYDVDSDTQAHKGAVRSKQVVDAMAAGGSGPFAYGVAGDATVTVTATHKAPTVDAGTELTAACVRRTVGGGTVDCGAATDVDGTTSVRTSVIDLMYDAASASYGMQLTLSGNGDVNAGFSGEDALWTVFAGMGHGAGVVVDSATQVHKDSLFTADPRVYFDSDGAAPADGDVVITPNAVWNRAETLSYAWYVLNANGEKLTRSLTFDMRGGGTSAGTFADTGEPYTGTFALPSTAPAVATEAGLGYLVRLTATDQVADSDADQFAVSSLYYTHVHPEVDTTLNVHDPVAEPHESHVHEFTISLEQVSQSCMVQGVRRQVVDTGVDAVSVAYLRPDGSSRQAELRQTGVDGWTTAVSSLGAEAPPGDWTLRCSVSWQGNTGTEDHDVLFKSAFTAHLAIRMVIVGELVVDEPATVYVRTEVTGNASEPDSVPVVRVGYVEEANEPETWVEAHEVTCVNVVDDTPTVNGTFYRCEFVPWRVGAANIEAFATIEGAGIHEPQSVEVREVEASWFTEGAWVLFTMAAVATFRYTEGGLRVLVAAAGLLILAMPLTDLQFYVLGLGQAGVLLVAGFQFYQGRR